MNVEIFKLERNQSLYENTVEFNLTESGVHPYSLNEILDVTEQQELLGLELGYGQTNGSEKLRGLIAGLYSDLDSDRLLVTNGSSEANFIAMWSLLEPGDEILYMQPNYMQIAGIARSMGIRVRPFHLREMENERWEPDISDLARLTNKKTRLVCICNPNNPTGSVLSEEHMGAIVNHCREHGLILYADEVYRGAELQGAVTPSVLDLYENSIAVGGMSKSMSLPGLRIGWLAGSTEFISRAWQHRDYTSISCGLISQFVAEKVLAPRFLPQVRQRAQAFLCGNLALLENWVSKQADRYVFIPPKAGGMLLLKYSMALNSLELTEFLRRDHSLLVVPGDDYDMGNYLRIGIGGDPAYLEAGLDRLQYAVGKL